MKKVEIIKIPYKPLFFKDSEGKSLISFIERSWLSFKGTGIVFFKDSEGKSLIVFSKKSYMNFKGTGIKDSEGFPLLAFQKKVI